MKRELSKNFEVLGDLIAALARGWERTKKNLTTSEDLNDNTLEPLAVVHATRSALRISCSKIIQTLATNNGNTLKSTGHDLQWLRDVGTYMRTFQRLFSPSTGITSRCGWRPQLGYSQKILFSSHGSIFEISYDQVLSADSYDFDDAASKRLCQRYGLHFRRAANFSEILRREHEIKADPFCQGAGEKSKFCGDAERYESWIVASFIEDFRIVNGNCPKETQLLRIAQTTSK